MMTKSSRDCHESSLIISSKIQGALLSRSSQIKWHQFFETNLVEMENKNENQKQNFHRGDEARRLSRNKEKLLMKSDLNESMID